MGRDREIEKEFIKQLALHVHGESFIIGSLRLIDTDESREEMIRYLKRHPKATQKEIEIKMFYLSISR